MRTTVRTEVPIKGMIKIGEIEGDTFYKQVIKSKHRFKLFDGYAIQKKAFDKLRGMVKYIVIEEDTGINYKSTISDWELHGSTWTGKDGQQKTLSVKYMEEL